MGEANIFFARGLCSLPALFPGDRFQPVQEARCHRRRAANLRGMTEDDVVGSEQLRKIMRGEADAPLRQIEAELVPHRPAQPRIDPRRRRPYAFDQPANNDPVGLRQPRFQRAVNSQRGARCFRPPHHAVAKRGLEHFRVITDLHQQPALRLSAEQIVERGCERQSVMALERQRDAMPVARQRAQHVAMALCQFGEIIGV